MFLLIEDGLAINIHEIKVLSECNGKTQIVMKDESIYTFHYTVHETLQYITNLLRNINTPLVGE